MLDTAFRLEKAIAFGMHLISMEAHEERETVPDQIQPAT
jgi:hypothetical protein